MMEHHFDMIASLDFCGNLLVSFQNVVSQGPDEEDSDIVTVWNQGIVFVLVLLPRVWVQRKENPWQESTLLKNDRSQAYGDCEIKSFKQRFR